MQLYQRELEERKRGGRQSTPQIRKGALSVQQVSTQYQSSGLLPSLSTSSSTSSSASSLDFESDEYFDANSEQLLDGGTAGDVVPSLNVPLDSHPDVEDDDHFYDMDDNTSRG